jgi:hypothetical protein
MILADPAANTILGQRVDGTADERLRQRIKVIAATSAARVIDRLDRLVEFERVAKVSFGLKVIPFHPVHKMYILNGEEVLYGPYEFSRTRVHLEVGEEAVEIYDILSHSSSLVWFGKDSAVGSLSEHLLRSHRAQFESLWSIVGKDSGLGQARPTIRPVSAERARRNGRRTRCRG